MGISKIKPLTSPYH